MVLEAEDLDQEPFVAMALGRQIRWQPGGVVAFEVVGQAGTVVEEAVNCSSGVPPTVTRLR